MASDAPVLAVDQDRIRPAEFGDARSDLRHLSIGVRARVSCVGDQRRDCVLFHVQHPHAAGCNLSVATSRNV